MAWVTLHDLLATDKNIRGAIPASAECTFILGAPEEETGPETVSGVPYMKKEAVERFESLKPRIKTIEDFIRLAPDLARGIEWTFEPKGKFEHWDLVEIDGGAPKLLIYCQLDVRPWLKKNPEAVRKIVEAVGEFWNRRSIAGSTEIVTFRGGGVEHFLKLVG
jgi:hypothetical protein